MEANSEVFKKLLPQYQEDEEWDLDDPQEAIYKNAGLKRYQFCVTSGIKKKMQAELNAEQLSSYQERTQTGTFDDLQNKVALKDMCKEYEELDKPRKVLAKLDGALKSLRTTLTQQNHQCIVKNSKDSHNLNGLAQKPFDTVVVVKCCSTILFLHA